MKVHTLADVKGSLSQIDDGLRDRIIANENGGTDLLLLDIGCKPYNVRFVGRDGKIERD